MVDGSMLGLNDNIAATRKIDGALRDAKRHLKKTAARLDIEHLQRIYEAVNVSLVLHGGMGIPKTCVFDTIGHGITRITVATAVRQPYEAARNDSIAAAQEAAQEAAEHVLSDQLKAAGGGSRIRRRYQCECCCAGVSWKPNRCPGRCEPTGWPRCCGNHASRLRAWP